MREALHGLTTRGRAFIAAGITAIACAMLFDQRPLVRVGVLLIVLPLITAFVVGRGRYRLSLNRVVEPHLSEAGQPARVDLTLTNEGWIPTGSLLLEESLPYSLGSRPRFVVDKIAHGWRRSVTYPVRSEVRGSFEIGPMTVRVSDPFGLVELRRSFRSTANLTVTPRVLRLTSIDLGGAESASGDSRPREFAGGSPEDVTVREYRRGDDLRRVHWRSSARVGELMVRREEQPWQARATIFLDNRRLVHRGSGATSSFEAAVVAAASVGVHLAGRGFTVRLVTSNADGVSSSWHSREGDTDVRGLLEEAAMVEMTSATTVDPSWIGESGETGLTVAVLGAVDESDVSVLRRVRHAGTALALHLEVDEWSGRALPTPAATHNVIGEAGLALLTAQGWRATSLGVSTNLDAAWRELGTRAGTASYGTPAEGRS